MLEGYPLEIALTAANAAAQAWYGYDQGVISGVLISPDFIRSFPQTRNPDIQGITASCFSLGNLVGCLLAALFGDRLGRKNTLRAGAALSIIGAVLQFLSWSFPQLIVGRIVNGFGNGMTSSTCGIYQAESCSTKRRGKTSVIVVLHNVVLYMVASWLTLACSYGAGGIQWRLPLALQLVPCIVMLSILPFIPDSPRWLLLRGRTDEANEAVRRYLGKGLRKDDQMVLDQLRSIQGALKIELDNHVSLKTVLLGQDRSGHLKRLLLGCGAQFMQQFGGINGLNYYFPAILENSLGMSDFMARVLTGCNAVSYTISSAMCFWFIDRFGRRSLMMSGSFLQFLAYVMVAIAVAYLPHAPHEWGSVAITFLFFFYAAFGCTWGMVPWIYQSEINSIAMRAKGSAAATSFNWLFGFVCTQFGPTAIANIGYRYYIIFACLNIVFVPVVYFFYPETANRTLEDLDLYFDKNSGNNTVIAISNKKAKQKLRPLEYVEAERQRIYHETETVKTSDLVKPCASHSS
ncbi:general substrate transporter [Pseudomassariella vexata]|uniref:General substrate transporter n=1 Tax=Pseudomassariella vexata TaxID=1141098 RepID=A0A1Y2E0T4_9PEZI|nr:general substrate transporter [Pseudomassariella vexata]ORY64475.1 general substrate transporter [Pseudomassariella vexata]